MVDIAALQATAYRWIIDAAARAISERDRFSIVLAGGNTPRGVYTMLRDATTDWSRWHIWFGDERCAPLNDPELNSVMAGTAWLDHVPIPSDQIHFMLTDQGANEAEQNYSQALAGVGDFDLVLLGLGEDGHTASLFPDHDWGVSGDAADAIAVFDAPKPPPQRVSMSAARLSHAREVLFLVDGDSKRDAAARWQHGDGIPAQAINPTAGVDVLIGQTLLLPDN